MRITDHTLSTEKIGCYPRFLSRRSSAFLNANKKKWKKEEIFSLVIVGAVHCIVKAAPTGSRSSCTASSSATGRPGRRPTSARSRPSPARSRTRSRSTVPSVLYLSRPLIEVDSVNEIVHRSSVIDLQRRASVVACHS